MNTTNEIEEFMRGLAELANQNRELMDGTTGPIKRMFEENDFVFGVWQDQSKPYGIDCLVLKGTKLLLESIASDQAVTARTTAIPCECLEQAIAAKQVFGTPDHDA